MNTQSINFVNGKVINNTATAENVKLFFKKDFNNYLMLSGKNRFDLSSPKLDSQPVAKKFNNGAENAMMRIIEAQSIIYCAGKAINNCTDSRRKPYKKILTLRYISELYDYQIYDQIGYSKTQYYRLRPFAFVEFATRFLYYQIINGTNEIIDLCIYK